MSAPTPPPAYRPPWSYLSAALLAMVALYLTGRSTVLFVVAPVLLAARFTDARLDDRTWQVWLTRFIASGLILTTGNDSGFRGADTFITGRTLDWVGQYCAVELTLQCWIRRPSPPAGWLTALSGIVFLAASNTTDTEYIRYLAPVYLVLAAVAMRAITERDRPPTAGPTPQVLAFAVGATVVAIGVGWAGFYGLWIWRGEITRWSNDLLFPDHSSRVGLSTSPRLGATRDLQGPLTRVLRIRRVGPPDPRAETTHLRALAFYTYEEGNWGPSLERRQFRSAAHLKQQKTPGTRLAITRFTANSGLLMAPLSVRAVLPEPGSELEWDPENGRAFRTTAEIPYDYEVVLGEPASGGPNTVPDDIERARCLEVPEELDPRVLAVAAAIGNEAASAAAGLPPSQAHSQEAARTRALVRGVEQYLTSNHEYSLTTDPGRGDPVSNFILEKKAAHCEYFASAAVVLLRCLGVPARYVSGYYAHEGTGFGTTIVRQRDAHAWAEALVDGAGWVTVEATPASGRPDATDGALPAWTRLTEWFQDMVDVLRGWIVGSIGITGAVVIGISIIAFLVWRDIRRSQRFVPAPVFAYCIPADLEGVADRFETLLAQKGWRCPPDRTWQEHLAPILQPVADPNDIDAEISPRLRESVGLFVGNYYRIRFGGTLTTENLEELGESLQVLEQEPWPSRDTLEPPAVPFR